MTPLTSDDVQKAWSRGRELLLKSSKNGPGWEPPPPREHPRAPRVDDQVEEPATGESKSSAPYKIQPITRGDLKDMKARSSYKNPPQLSARPKANGPGETVSADTFAKPRTRVGRAQPSMYGTRPNMSTF